MKSIGENPNQLEKEAEWQCDKPSCKQSQSNLRRIRRPGMIPINEYGLIRDEQPPSDEECEPKPVLPAYQKDWVG